MEHNKQKLLLEALQNVKDKNKVNRKRIASNLGSDIKSKNYAKGALDNEINRVKSSGLGRDLTEPTTKISGGNKIPKIENYNQDLAKYTKRTDDLAKKGLVKSFKRAAELGDKPLMDSLRQQAKMFAKKAAGGLKMLPLVGAAASLMMSPEDASAAIPGLDSADNVGMSAADENMMLAERQGMVDYQQSQAKKDKLAALAALIKKGQ